MEAITINNKKYTLSDDIIEATPIWCKGVRNGRELVKKKKIEEKHFVYARYVNEEWVQNEGKSAKYDKVLIRNICLNKIENYIKEINDDDDIVDEDNVEKAPKIITLSDNEKFCDDNGYMLEIETRGIKEDDKIYFRVKDASEQFEMNDLQDVLIRKTSSYLKNIDYKYFLCEIPINGRKKTSKNKVTKELFLTYQGILRVLIISRCGNANKFRDWATKTLFTVQMGTQAQKKKLVSSVLGIPIDEFNKIMLKPNTKTEISSIYFITLGTAKDLRESMCLDYSILDDDVISIYGKTKDLRRRLQEHKNKYKNIQGANLLLKYYSFVDKTLLSKAEKKIGDYFKSFDAHLGYDTDCEMVCTDMNCVTYLEDQYETIRRCYGGDSTEIITQMNDIVIAHKFEIAEKNHEIAEKNHEMELLKTQHKLDIALEKNEAMKWKLKHYERCENDN
jgi:hypothetical protein